MSERTWATIWEARQLDPERSSLLAQLMAADGFDSGFGNVDEAAWLRYVGMVEDQLGIAPGSSVYEVGCGAGAFVYPLYQAGCPIGALDASETLLGYAARVMPNATLCRAEAAALDPSEPYDFVVSNGVFLYFPSLDYARGVLERMAKKARRGLAVLDVPCLAKRSAAEQMRRGYLSEAEYEAKYRGLEHLYFDRGWFDATLRELGFTSVTIADQQIAGYANGPYRFNVFARREY